LQNIFIQTNCHTPVQFFKQNLIKNYKLAQETEDEEVKDNPDEEIAVAEDDEMNLPGEEEDPNA
jgi:hypothetical protein